MFPLQLCALSGIPRIFIPSYTPDIHTLVYPGYLCPRIPRIIPSYTPDIHTLVYPRYSYSYPRLPRIFIPSYTPDIHTLVYLGYSYTRIPRVFIPSYIPDIPTLVYPGYSYPRIPRIFLPSLTPDIHTLVYPGYSYPCIPPHTPGYLYPRLPRIFIPSYTPDICTLIPPDIYILVCKPSYPGDVCHICTLGNTPVSLFAHTTGFSEISSSDYYKLNLITTYGPSSKGLSHINQVGFIGCFIFNKKTPSVFSFLFLLSTSTSPPYYSYPGYIILLLTYKC